MLRLVTALRHLAVLVALSGPLAAAPVQAQHAWSLRIPAVRLARRLHHPDPAAREAAARALGTAGDPHRARLVLLDALASERNQRVRIAIGQSLTLRAHPEILPGLSRAFEEARDTDARALALALAAIGTPEAATILTQALTREERAAGARVALERMGISAAPQLARLLREDPTVVTAIDLLGRAADVESVPLLVELTHSEVPNVRRAAVTALGRIGDTRARGAIVAVLDDPEPSVAHAAWEALRQVGGSEDAERVLAALRDADDGRRIALLRTLLVLDEQRAAQVVAQWVADAALVQGASDLALEHPRPALVPVLYGLLREGSRRDEAASALAEVEGGAGVGVLLREAELPAARRALAVAVRRWRDVLPRGIVRAARRVLAQAHREEQGDATMRALVLRALAQDRGAVPFIEQALHSGNPHRRALAAHAAWLLADDSLREAVATAAGREKNPETWRVMALALPAVGAAMDVDRGALFAALTDPARAPEAALVAAQRNQWTPRDRRRVGRVLRRMLRDEDERARSCAAWSLARLGEASAWRALLVRVDRDPSTVVRRAAARALAAVAPPAAHDRLLQRSYEETDDEVRGWLERAARGSAYPPARGRQVLRLRVVTEDRTDGVVADVVLPDGRWLRLPTLATGELFLADLPESVVDVRVAVR